MKSLLCVWSIITFVSQYHSKIIRNLGEEHSVLAAKELNISITLNDIENYKISDKVCIS